MRSGLDYIIMRLSYCEYNMKQSKQLTSKTIIRQEILNKMALFLTFPSFGSQQKSIITILPFTDFHWPAGDWC